MANRAFPFPPFILIFQRRRYWRQLYGALPVETAAENFRETNFLINAVGLLWTLWICSFPLTSVFAGRVACSKQQRHGNQGESKHCTHSDNNLISHAFTHIQFKLYHLGSGIWLRPGHMHLKKLLDAVWYKAEQLTCLPTDKVEKAFLLKNKKFGGWYF